MVRRCALLMLAFGLGQACSGSAPPPGRDPLEHQPAPGAGVQVYLSDRPIPVPDLRLADLDGKAVNRAAWKGKVVVLNFWATWCGPCRQEIPDLIALQDRYRDWLVVVGLSVDDDPPAAVRKYAATQHFNYQVAIAGDLVQEQFGGLPTIPSTFVVNRQGLMVLRHKGLANANQIEQEVRALSGLPTQATVQTVQDIGQILPSSAK